MSMYYYVPLLSYDGGKPAIAFIFPPLQFPHSGALEENMEILTTSSKNKQPALQDVLKVKLKEEKHNLNPNIDDGKEKNMQSQ